MVYRRLFTSMNSFSENPNTQVEWSCTLLVSFVDSYSRNPDSKRIASNKRNDRSKFIMALDNSVVISEPHELEILLFLPFQELVYESGSVLVEISVTSGTITAVADAIDFDVVFGGKLGRINGEYLIGGP